MKEFKGTPGPWHVSNEGCMLIRDDAGLSIVAKYVGYTNDEEEISNANLITTAPELLSVLQDALNAQILPEYHSEKAKAAIGKALGESE